MSRLPHEIGQTPWRARFGHYWRLVRADRPIGIYLLLWPAMWGLWFAAEGLPPAWILFVFVAGTVLMRSAGCAINDYADRDFDGHVERTAARPLATGAIRPQEALGVFAALSLVAFALVLTLNPMTVAHSFVALALAAVYPFTKRISHMPQLMLGVAFGWAVPMAFTAIQEQIPAVAWWLFAATVTWALIYDTMYAMVDRNDDLAIGVKSTAILFGRFDTRIIALMQLLMLAMLGWVGLMTDRGVWYFAGLLLAALLFARQQWQIRDRGRDACFRAFLNNHYVGLVVFVGILLDFL